MIRGPVLPKMRDSLWELVSARLDQIESGLTLVLESLECGVPREAVDHAERGTQWAARCW